MITTPGKYFHKVTIKSLPSLSNRHQHWSKTTRERKEWHSKVIAAFHLHPKKPLELVALRLCRYSTRMPDYDNLVISFKSVADGLIHAGIIKDDNMNVVVERQYTWCKVRKGQEQITIEVEQLDYVNI